MCGNCTDAPGTKSKGKASTEEHVSDEDSVSGPPTPTGILRIRQELKRFGSETFMEVSYEQRHWQW